jgi:hypothetical protein
MERCHREIAAVKVELLAGNPDTQGLCLALSNWSAALRIQSYSATEIQLSSQCAAMTHQMKQLDIHTRQARQRI